MLWEHKIPTAIKAHRIFAELAKTTSFKKGVTKIKKKKKGIPVLQIKRLANYLDLQSKTREEDCYLAHTYIAITVL